MNTYTSLQLICLKTDPCWSANSINKLIYSVTLNTVSSPWCRGRVTERCLLPMVQGGGLLSAVSSPSCREEECADVTKLVFDSISLIS